MIKRRWLLPAIRARRLGCTGVVSLTAFSLASCTQRHISFLDPQGPIAAAQRGHYWFVVAIVMVVVLPVIILTPLIVWRYRYGGHAVYRPKWAFSSILDIFIWGVPFLIVAILSYVLWQATSALDPYKPLPSNAQPLKVQVVGLDWKWLFIYPDQGIATVDKLVFPADRPVAFELTSATVMQTFFIPALGGQMDAMNRMVTKLHLAADKPGTFQGRNMQYNGKGFYKQKFTAQAVDEEAFASFVQSAREAARPLGKPQYETLMRKGSGEDAAKALGVMSSTATLQFSQVPKGFFSAVVQDGPIDWARLTTASSILESNGQTLMNDASAVALAVTTAPSSRHKETVQ